MKKSDETLAIRVRSALQTKGNNNLVSAICSSGVAVENCQLAINRHFTHPVKEDVKKKGLSRPLAGSQGW